MSTQNRSGPWNVKNMQDPQGIRLKCMQKWFDKYSNPVFGVSDDILCFTNFVWEYGKSWGNSPSSLCCWPKHYRSPTFKQSFYALVFEQNLQLSKSRNVNIDTEMNNKSSQKCTALEYKQDPAIHWIQTRKNWQFTLCRFICAIYHKS